MLAAAAWLATVALPALAHAYLDRAQPVAGSVVHESPRELTLFDGADAKVLRVPLPKLAAGTYRVKWRILSVDTHVSEGEFTFDVAP